MAAYTEEEKAKFRALSDKINAALDIVEGVFETLNNETGGNVAFLCMVDAGAGGATASNVTLQDGILLAQRCLSETARTMERRARGEPPESEGFTKQ